MSHYVRGLLFRALLAFLGVVLAFGSFSLRPDTWLNFASTSSQSNNYDTGWSNDYADNNYDSNSDWDFGGSDDSSWDSGGGWDDSSWDSGDSGSWDDSGGDSGGW